MSMEEDLGKFIISGKFEEAKESFIKMDKKEARDYLIQLGYETENVSIYSFLCSIICELENADIHYLLSEILTMPLCHLEGAYASGLYHAKKALKLAPNDIGLQEYLLLFYNIPERLINSKEAVTIAKKVLESKPESEVAKKVLQMQIF